MSNDSNTGPHVAEKFRERWDPADEPTRLERLICSQFRRGIPVPLSAKEQQEMLALNIEQRCDYIAKIAVWTSRAVEKRLRESDPGKK